MGKVLSAQGSGYFPNCIEQVENITYPLKGSLVNMMGIYWRVKKWTGSLSGTAFIFGQPENEIIFSGAEFDIPNRDGERTEESLICNPSVDFLSERVVVGRIVRNDEQITGQYRIFINMRGDLVAQKQAGNVYSYPNLISVNIGFYGDFFVNKPTPFQIVGTWSVNWYGGSISGTLYARDQSDKYLDPNVTLTITAKEYYSYGGTYNTQTGTPL
jgi:hypothetical protein